MKQFPVVGHRYTLGQWTFDIVNNYLVASSHKLLVSVSLIWPHTVYFCHNRNTCQLDDTQIPLSFDVKTYVSNGTATLFPSKTLLFETLQHNISFTVIDSLKRLPINRKYMISTSLSLIHHHGIKIINEEDRLKRHSFLFWRMITL